MRGQNVRITLEDVTYSVKHARKKGEMAHLLKNVSGFLNPGEMSALMGPSGSGKTTLLDLLAGRKTTGKLQGQVLFSGIKPTPEYLRRYTGYVEQFDTLLPILSVYEMLLYTAELKRPLKESLGAKKQAVEELIAQLGLDVCRSTVIGSQMKRGISGGQAKRTNIGIALITNPRVLFLDEPTTGLDSYTSNEVMTAVKALADSGVTVCATIHSPTAYCFSLFDRMLMLVQGSTVYFGARAEAITFFQNSCPHVKEYLQGYNDAEYITDLVTEADRLGKGDSFAEAYANSAAAASNRQQLHFYLEERAEISEELLKELQVRRSTVTPWWWGLRTFLKYRTSKNYRDPAFLAPRIFDKLMISILVMTLYLGIGKDDSPENVINISAVLFMWSATPGFVAASYIPTLVLERGLFVRERSDGLYLVFTYLVAKMLDEIIVNAIASLGISAFTFYGVRLQGDFSLFYISYLVAVCTGIILAYLVASISPNMDVANALLPTYAVTLLFFCGFLIRMADIPPWWKWYSYLDFAKYSWGANMMNQFSHLNTPYLNGETVLEYYDLAGEKTKWGFVGYTSLFFAFFFVCTLLVLQFRKFQIR